MCSPRHESLHWRDNDPLHGPKALAEEIRTTKTVESDNFFLPLESGLLELPVHRSRTRGVIIEATSEHRDLAGRKPNLSRSIRSGSQTDAVKPPSMRMFCPVM